MARNGDGSLGVNNPGNGATVPAASIFDDVEKLKRETAAKLGSRTTDGAPELTLGRPCKTWIFRTPKDEDQLFAGAVWEDPDTRITYFVAPDLWELDDFEGALKPVIFVPYVTAAVDTAPIYGVWPVSTTPGNSYCESAQDVVERARHSWGRTWPVLTKQIYRWKPSEKDYGEPKWLDLTIFAQLKILFKDKREILSEDHSVIRRCRGLQG
jgi:hypothetical protein